jgi:hypothetical protein
MYATLKAISLVLLSLIIIFVFLSFSSPHVPFSRIRIEGAQRIEIGTIRDYINSKTWMGLVPTSTKKYVDASETLGPLVERIDIDPNFFFRATVTIKEKQDTFVLCQGNNMARIAVDIEGNYISDITPSDDALVELSLFSKNPSQVFDLECLNNHQYPFEANIDNIPKEIRPYLVQGVVAKILQTRDSMGFTFMNLIVNNSTRFLYKNHRGEYIFVGPSNDNPLFTIENGDIVFADPPEIEEASTEYTSKKKDPKKAEYIMYTKVNLENAQGIFAETAQGSIVFFGTNNYLDIKFGALGHLADDLFMRKEDMPICIKLDIPYQVTTVPRKPVIGSS